MATLGENIRALRMSRGYSQDRFARELGTNQVNVSAWEIGTRTPYLETVKHIANTFHVPLSSLISLEDTGNEDDFVREVAGVIQRDQKVRMIFDKIRYMPSADLDTVLSVVNAISRNQVENT